MKKKKPVKGWKERECFLTMTFLGKVDVFSETDKKGEIGEDYL